MRSKEEVVRKLRNLERPYKTGYEPAPHLREDLAEVLETPQYRNLNELLNVAVSDLIRKHRKKTISKDTITIE
jgi:hypothetical protein